MPITNVDYKLQAFVPDKF